MLCLWQWIGLYCRRYGIKGLRGFVCDYHIRRSFNHCLISYFYVIFCKTKRVPRFSTKRFFFFNKKRIPLKSSVETGNYKLAAPVDLTGFVKHLCPFKDLHFLCSLRQAGQRMGVWLLQQALTPLIEQNSKHEGWIVIRGFLCPRIHAVFYWSTPELHMKTL